MVVIDLGGGKTDYVVYAGGVVAAGDKRRNTQLFQYDDLYRITRAQEELGYVVRPLEESIADAWNWFRAEGYA